MTEFAKHALTLTEPKKHSVRYDTEAGDGVAVRTLYVSKDALPMPFPKSLVITLETLPTGE